MRLTFNRRAHRAFLADLLWSESDEEKGRASLRQAVLAIRQHWGEGYLITEGKELLLAGELHCDAALFVEAARAGDFPAALEQYRGDFFEQFALPGARGFELWATVERERLRGTFIRTADVAAQHLLDEGHARAAADVATRLVRSDDLRERSWRLLLECRLAQGDLTAAGVDAAAMQAVLAAKDVELEAATDALLRRIQRGRETVPETEPSALRAELVGRTGAFAALLDAWKQVERDGAVVRTLTGDAGMGKTRLLEDLSARLRSLGARVVTVTAQLVEREIPYALVAQIAEALVHVPGAAGVSPESARTLVALEPRLRSVFYSVDADPTLSVDLPRQRAIALADLLGAVSDDRAIAVLIDDLHWADDASVQTLAAATLRLSGARAMLVLTQRHRISGTVIADDIALDRLSNEDVHELVASLAPLTESAWAARLGCDIASATGGVPLLVMEALQLLTQEGLLVRGESAWGCADEAALATRLETLDVQKERLLQLDGDMRRTLLHTALAGCALQDAILASSMGAMDIAPIMQRLQTGGWILRVGLRALVRHDEIARSVREASDETVLTTARDGLRRALGAASTKSDAEWRLEARLALESSDFDALSQTLDRWIAGDALTRRRAGWRGAMSVLLGDQASEELLRQVRRRRPVWQRLRRQSRTAVIVIAALLMISAIGAMRHHRAVTPVALRFAAAPLAGSSMGITPEVVVEFVNQDGERVRFMRDTVTLTLGETDAKLAGETVVVADSGIAVFRSARILGYVALKGSLRATAGRLSTPWVPLLALKDATLRIASVRIADSASGSVKGDTLIVRRGAAVIADVNLTYSSPWMAAAVMLAGVPTWGDNTTNSIELGPSATPIRNGTRFSPIPFTASDRPGHYRIFIAMGAESDAAHIASGTNWFRGAPVWRDGNDIASWGDAKAAEAKRTGHVSVPPDGWLYKSGTGPVELGVAVLEVVVR